jgi:hypothetical protein
VINKFYLRTTGKCTESKNRCDDESFIMLLPQPTLQKAGGKKSNNKILLKIKKEEFIN